MFGGRVREDDKIIMDCIYEYGALTKEQLRQYMKHLSDDVFDRAIYDLNKKQYIYEHGDYVYTDSRTPLDPKTIKAFWVFLRFMEKVPTIRFNSHCRGPHISQIFFMKDNSEYQIVVIDNDELPKINILVKNKDLTYLKYIIIVPGISIAREIRNRMKDVSLENETIFAIVTERKNQTRAIRFISPSGQKEKNTENG